MIGVYCRVSTEGQRDSYSIKQQREDGINFAVQNDEDYDVYEDIWTGKELTRKGWESLIKDIKQNGIDKVWIKIFDRLSRNTRDALDIIEIMKEYGVSLYVDGTFYDLHDYNVVMLLTIQFAVATNEGQKIVTRSLEGKKAEIDAGKRRFCYVYGYSYKYNEDGSKHWYIVPEQAEVIRYIFKLATEEKLPLSHIVKRLNQEGYKPLKVEYWEPSAVSRILKRIEYTGYTYNSKSEVIKHQFYSPIIDFETWKKAQDLYEECITSNSRRGRHATHPATNIFKCAKCGAGYYYHEGVRTQKKDGKIVKKYKRQQYAHKFDTRYGKPTCSQKPKYIPYKVFNWIAAYTYIYAMLDKRNTENILHTIDSDIKQQSSKLEKDIKRLDTRINQVQKEISNYKKAIAKGLDIEDAINEINERKKLLTDLSNTRQDKLSSIEAQKQEYHNILSEFATERVSEYFHSSNVEKRNKLKRIVEYATIDGKDVEVKLISGTVYTFNVDNIRKQVKDVDWIDGVVETLINSPEITIEDKIEQLQQIMHDAENKRQDLLETTKVYLGKELRE